MQNGYYSFETTGGADESGFSILNQNNFLATKDVQIKDVIVYKDNNESVGKGNSNVTSTDLYDASGKLIRSISDKKSKEIRINAAGFTKGIYILKITSEKGIITKKLL